MATKSWREKQKRPDVSSLKGREAGTSTRSKKGIQVGSKARRKLRRISDQGVMVEASPKKKPVKSFSKAMKKGKVQRKKVAKKKVAKKRKVRTKGPIHEF